MDEAQIDTDTLSEIIKAKNSQVLHHANQYLTKHAQLSFSAITYYELVRGLRQRQAGRLSQALATLVNHSLILPVSLPVLARAAELWAYAFDRGLPRNDADLIIAASALEFNRVLVTGNTSHFAWVPQLRLQNWRQP